MPAQALILLNDPFVHQQAELWAKEVLAKPGTDEERVNAMYLSAFGRAATDREQKTIRDFMVGCENQKWWIELAHMLFNVKEFIFIN